MAVAARVNGLGLLHRTVTTGTTITITLAVYRKDCFS